MGGPRGRSVGPITRHGPFKSRGHEVTWREGRRRGTRKRPGCRARARRPRPHVSARPAPGSKLAAAPGPPAAAAAAMGEEDYYLELCERPVQFEKANPVNCVFFDEANKQVPPARALLAPARGRFRGCAHAALCSVPVLPASLLDGGPRRGGPRAGGAPCAPG